MLGQTCYSWGFKDIFGNEWALPCDFFLIYQALVFDFKVTINLIRLLPINYFFKQHSFITTFSSFLGTCLFLALIHLWTFDNSWTLARCLALAHHWTMALTRSLSPIWSLVHTPPPCSPHDFCALQTAPTPLGSWSHLFQWHWAVVST